MVCVCAGLALMLCGLVCLPVAFRGGSHPKYPFPLRAMSLRMLSKKNEFKSLASKSLDVSGRPLTEGVGKTCILGCQQKPERNAGKLFLPVFCRQALAVIKASSELEWEQFV